jgi:dTMP kinase
MPLIVLEGLDGAGKSTQLNLLRKHLAEKGYPTEYLHFPRFKTPLYGELAARFLRGDFGENVDPYTLALIFAGDRKQAAPTLRDWLAAGKWVLLDRYVYSNVGYQCAKIADPEERNRLKQWILELEYEIYKIPRPDVSLFLDVPFRFTESRLKSRRQGADRDYLQGAADIHESSLELQKRVREVYLEAAKHDPALKIVDCSGPNKDIAAAGGVPTASPAVRHENETSKNDPASHPKNGDSPRQMLPPDEIFTLISKKYLHLP